jgi:hypothetical protein
LDLLIYISNGKIRNEYTIEQMDLFKEFESKWWDVPSEDPDEERSLHDKLLDEYIEKVMYTE